MCYTLSMNITQEIENLIDQYHDQLGLTAKKINNGKCMKFAEDIVDLGFLNCVAIWGDDLPYSCWSKVVQILWDNELEFYVGGHCFIMYNNKYYDSECSQGCNYPDKLPFYQRQIAFTLSNTMVIF